MSFEIIVYLKNAINNAKIIKPKLNQFINKCEICAFIKTHKLIFQKSDHKEISDALFKKTDFDFIQQNQDYVTILITIERLDYGFNSLNYLWQTHRAHG